MRTLALVTVALALGATPASAWEEYAYPDRGFAIQFPVAPTVETSVYAAPLAGERPSTVYMAEHENILYRVEVADFSGMADNGANFLGEAAYFLMREGDVIFNDIPRVEGAARGIFGIGMVLDTEDDRRVRTSVYFNRNWLYRVDAIVLPARGDKDMAVPSRFDQTLRFNVVP